MSAPSRSETMTLEFPLQLADRTLTEVIMRRPIMRDVRRFPIKNNTDYDGEFRQFAFLCGLRPEEMEEMDTADYARLQQIYARFRTPAERGADQGADPGPVSDDQMGTA
jgi:hypothetical protein